MAPRRPRQAQKSKGGASFNKSTKSRQQASTRSRENQEDDKHSRDRHRNRPEVAEKASASDDDDEEIDEDAAFDEEDEMKYGDIFGRMKGSRATKSRRADEDENDEEEDDEDEGDGDGEYEEYDDETERALLADGGTLLSDLLSGTSATPASSAKKPKGRKQKPAFDEEEEEYSDIDADEYSDDEHGPNSGLLDVVQQLSAQTGRKADAASRTDISQLTSSVDIAGGLSMDALVGALKDTQGYSGMAQSLLKLNSSSTTARPVEAVTDARAARKALYSHTADDITKWQDTIATNRSAKTLDLAQDKRDYVRNTSAQEVIRRFKPTSELEQDVEMILVQANAHGPGLDHQEQDELEAAEVSLEELKERHAEIEKARALMTYYQRKRHQINKIKSKAYRRIRKKQKERRDDKERELIEQTDPELALQLAEADAVKRLEERMSLRHKNTSKWAKMALAHGGTTNDSFREALQEQLLLGEELRKKINMQGGESDEDNSDDSDVDVSRTEAVAQAKDRLLALDDEDKNAEVDGKYSKLFQMKFMQRKANEQKEQAKRDAQALLEELEGISDDEGEGSDDEDANSDDESVGQHGDRAGLADASVKSAKASKEDREAAKRKIAEMIKSGAFQMQGSSFGAGENASLAVDIAKPQSKRTTEDGAGIQAPRSSKAGRAPAADESGDEGTSNPWLAAPVRERKSLTKARGGKRKDDVQVDVAAAVETLVKKSAAPPAENDAVSSKSKKRRADVPTAPETAVTATPGAIVTSNKVEPDAAAAMDEFGKRPKQAAEATSKPAAKQKKLPGENPADEPKKLVSTLTQNELIEMAFVAPDLEDDFRKSKDAEIDDELEITKRKQKELQNDKRGWGSWAGMGAAPMSAGAKRRRDEKLKQLDDEDNKKKMARKDAKMPNVMVSERRVKMAGKYKIGDIPHPFTSREQYERAMQMPVGPEWNTSQIVRKNTKPEVITKAGRIIEPIALPKSAKKKAAANARK